MSTRRLIQFGKNSYVLSLPKAWVERNKLAKGSEINVEESVGSLLLLPSQNDVSAEVKVKRISCDNEVNVGRSIIAAYMNNYSIIEIYGSTLKDRVKEIENVTHSMVALEIMEQTPKKVVIKDFLNTQDISMENIIKRMDIIIRAMFSEIQKSFEKKENIDLDKGDTDVNRLFYVGQKLLNKLIDSPNLSKKLDMNIRDTIFYFKILESLEKIADQQKRFVRNINNLGNDCPTISPLKNAFELMTKEYLDCVKALYKLDKIEADIILSSKKRVIDIGEEVINKYLSKCKKTADFHNTTEAVEKLKRFENYVTQIAKAIINKE